MVSLDEKRFYNHLSLVYDRISRETHRERLRWFLEREEFSKWEVNAIEQPIRFKKRKP